MHSTYYQTSKLLGSCVAILILFLYTSLNVTSPVAKETTNDAYYSIEILVSREKEKIRFGCQLLNEKTHFRCLVSTTFMSKWILKAEGRALRWYFNKQNTILTYMTACTKQAQWRNTSWRALEIESMLYFGHFSTFYEVYINNK